MNVSTKLIPEGQAEAALEEQILADLLVSRADCHGCNNNRWPPFGAVWPRTAHAIVEPVGPCVMQSAPHLRNEWKARFAPQSAPAADPLTGWTGGSDCLQQLELRFPSRAAAEAYLKRQGLSYHVHDSPARRWKPAMRRKDSADIVSARDNTGSVSVKHCRGDGDD